MTPAREDKLMSMGCATSFMLIIILSALAYFIDRSYYWWAFVVLFIWGVIGTLRSKREDKKLQAAFTQAFANFQGLKPKLTSSNSYGYPSFTLRFIDEQNMNLALQGEHVSDFKCYIYQRYGHVTIEGNAFDVNTSVITTYDGQYS